jgi:23S rRNA pseudouridine1911/1915/1917 synthase
VGQRFDRALVQALSRIGVECSRSQLTRAFEAGGVLIEGKPVKPSRPVTGPVSVRLTLARPVPLRAEPEDIALEIVHEDEHLLVIDKPAGMVVHAGPGHPSGTLVAAVLHHMGVQASALPTLPGNDELRPGIVHRLDKDTSGLIVVAKTMPALTHLARQFERHDIDRAYVGIVVGEVPWGVRRVETLHGRDPRDRRRYRPDVGKRRAITEATVMQRLRAASVVRFELETGRTHQIRMHAKHLGHPIFGDDLYGRPPKDPVRRELWTTLGRHALHAAVLGFDHPGGSGRLQLSSELPVELQALLRSLGGDAKVEP